MKAFLRIFPLLLLIALLGCSSDDRNTSVAAEHLRYELDEVGIWTERQACQTEEEAVVYACDAVKTFILPNIDYSKEQWSAHALYDEDNTRWAVVVQDSSLYGQDNDTAVIVFDAKSGEVLLWYRVNEYALALTEQMYGEAWDGVKHMYEEAYLVSIEDNAIMEVAVGNLGALDSSMPIFRIDAFTAEVVE
ncbi:MAG: hypothetical protein Q4C01_05905 [Clostridia bacterium]|nr:hypothetical protein [Clostridia bacterium]